MDAFMRWLKDYTQDPEPRRKGNLQADDLGNVDPILCGAHCLPGFRNAGNKAPRQPFVAPATKGCHGVGLWWPGSRGVFLCM